MSTENKSLSNYQSMINTAEPNWREAETLKLSGLHVTAERNNSPIRLIRCVNADSANRIAAELADDGFFTSPVFFPVVARNKPAIRITLRVDMELTLIQDFCNCLIRIVSNTEFAQRLL